MNISDKKLFQGVVWNFLERFGTQAISIVFTIILTRLISPQDYGIISLVTVFISIINVIVDSGFGAALIQKKEVDNRDFSTVFYFSMGLSFLMMAGVILLAPMMADFYHQPVLTSLMYVLAFKIPLVSVNGIQQSFIIRRLEFPKFFVGSVVSMFVAGVVGIYLAYQHFGVWALVIQDFTNTVVNLFVLLYLTKWKPQLYFSLTRLKALFGFGWKLLLQSLFNSIFANLRSLLIGKYYSPKDLAYYSKGIQYPNLIVTNIDTALARVLFPVMSKVQDSLAAVKELARKSTQVSSYILSPFLMFLAVASENFVILLLTEKWLAIQPYLVIICICLLIRAPQTSLLQGIKSIGRSDVVLRMDVPIRIFGFLLLLISIRFGIVYIALSEIVIEFIVLLLYMYFGRQLLDYSYREVLSDFGGNVCLSALMGFMVYGVNLLPLTVFYRFSLQILVCLVSYLTLSIFLQNKSYILLKNLLLRNIRGRHDTESI